MPLTTDPNDPRLGRGVDTERVGQNEVYLVLSQEERDKGFVRPVRTQYIHTGIRPRFPTRPLTDDEQGLFGGNGYVLCEDYPESEAPKVGRFWTKADLESGCQSVTSMGLALCETYAAKPKFYGATYCCNCGMHLPVGEFRWIERDGTTGPVVGS